MAKYNPNVLPRPRLHPLRGYTRLGEFNRQPTASTANVCEFKLPIGYAYEELAIKMNDAGGARTEAEILVDLDYIRLLIDGKEYRKCSIKELIDCIISFYGDSRGRVMTNNGILPIPFAAFHLKREGLARALALGTADVTNVTLELSFTASGGCTVLAPYGITCRNTICGPIVCWRRYPGIPRSATGLQRLTEEITRTPGARLMALHLYELGSGGSGDLTDWSYEINKGRVWQGEANHELDRLRNAGRTPQTGWVHFDFTTPDNSLEGCIPFSGDSKRGHPVVAEHALELTWATAPTTFDIFAEQIEVVPPSR